MKLTNNLVCNISELEFGLRVKLNPRKTVMKVLAHKRKGTKNSDFRKLAYAQIPLKLHGY